MKKIVLSFAVVALTGCTAMGGAFRPETSAGIVSIGKEQFVTSRTGASFTSLAEIKANAIRDGGQFCQAMKKEIQVDNVKETAMTIGVYPAVEITFSCR